jgi:hypothetical protein
MNRKFKLSDKDTGEIVEMTVADILEHINDGHSDEWQAYDDTDWMDGMLNFGNYNILFDKGQVFEWTHPTDETDKLIVTLIQNTIVTEFGDMVMTDAGEFSLSDLTIH